MKRIGSLDIAKNLKLRGKVVDKLVVEGGFYSSQFGEVSYGGSSGTITVKETDGTPPLFSTTVLTFHSNDFYLSSDSSGKPIVSSRAAGSVGPQGPAGSNTIDVSDGVETFNDTDALNFFSDHFYLTKTSGGKPVVNLVSGYAYVEESDARAFITPGSFTDFIEMSRIPMPGPCDSRTRYKVSWTIPWKLATSGYSSTDRVSQGVVTSPFNIQILINNGATGAYNEAVKSYPNQAFVLNPAQTGNFSGSCILTPSPTQTRLGISYSYNGFYSLDLQSLSRIGSITSVNTANLLIERLPR